MSRSLGSHQKPNRGASDDWLTPPEIVLALSPFDLDPCASVDQPWKTADTQWTVDDNGFDRPWHGLVWLNPPFGPDAEKWVARLADHGNGIALVPARTETRWFVGKIWDRANAILFLHGRPHFHHPVSGERGKLNSGAPIVLVAYGQRASLRLAGSELAGTFISLRPTMPGRCEEPAHWMPTGQERTNPSAYSAPSASVTAGIPKDTQ